jgi:TRAP-type C4-dicarboxylate transport system permease small subunit
LFYGLFLPVGVLANLALGVVILTGLRPAVWSDWLQIATGALCCVIAGWLAAAAWSKFYWYRSITRQVATWSRIADAFFEWVEQAPVPAESLRSLKSSLEEAVPSSEAR